MPITTVIAQNLTPENLKLWLEQATTIVVTEIKTHPFHIFIEVVFVLALVFMVFIPKKHRVTSASASPDENKLTREEEQDLIDSWVSERFNCPQVADPEWKEPVICRNEGIVVDLKDWTGSQFKNVVNNANFDFLSMATHPKMIDMAAETTVEYGIGSCGPRGFYGTLKPHLTLEQSVATFLRAPTAIVYSCSFASPSTVLPCFAARGDEILCDEACNMLNQHACSLARANVVYHRHLDLKHLEELMKLSHEVQRKRSRALPRRWVVVEGLFRNTGEIAPVDKIVALAKKYKYRVMLDDNVAFGTLGHSGRGTPELFNVPLKDIDVYLGSFACATGSVGGFCVGTEMVTDHQRLGATGYVFSAAACAYSSTCASLAVSMLDDDNSAEHHRPARVQRNAHLFREHVSVPSSVTLLGGHKSCSPCIHFRRNADLALVPSESTPASLKRSMKKITQQFMESSSKFREVTDAVLRRGFLITRVEYNHEERVPVPPSLRVNLKSEMSHDQVSELALIVGEELQKVFGK